MTQLRKCKCGISNYFDTLLSGIGHRGSSFSDIDAVTHDEKTGRFLIQEFKNEGEAHNAAQYRALRDISKIPKHFTVWQVVKRRDGLIGWAVYGSGKPLQAITRAAYRAHFQAWWESRQYHASDDDAERAAIQAESEELTADDIKWG